GVPWPSSAASRRAMNQAWARPQATEARPSRMGRASRARPSRAVAESRARAAAASAGGGLDMGALLSGFSVSREPRSNLA
ncbi:hypothetical protein HMPREF0731_3905, partial [Pseudoroseomonas cervicalis ATCC 49957]